MCSFLLEFWLLNGMLWTILVPVTIFILVKYCQKPFFVHERVDGKRISVLMVFSLFNSTVIIPAVCFMECIYETTRTLTLQWFIYFLKCCPFVVISLYWYILWVRFNKISHTFRINTRIMFKNLFTKFRLEQYFYDDSSSFHYSQKYGFIASIMLSCYLFIFLIILVFALTNAFDDNGTSITVVFLDVSIFLVLPNSSYGYTM